MSKLITKKKLIIRVLLVIEVITLLLIIMTLSRRNAYNLAEMKIKKDEGLFAIMLNDGSGDYVKSDSDTFPTGYNFNSEKSNCIDNTGEIVPDILSFNTSTNKVNVRTTKTVYCYLYFDKKNDLKIAVSTDGTSGKAPTTLNYQKNITCNTSTPSWNNKYNRLVFDNIGDSEECNLTFTKDTSTKNYLTTKIISMKGSTSGTGKIVDEGNVNVVRPIYTPTVKLEKNEYSNLVNDASYEWSWDSTDKIWTSTNHNHSTTSEISFTPNVNGYYQICYKQGSEKNWDYAKVYKDNTEIISLKGVSNTDYECKYLGELTTSNKIKVTYQKDSSGSTDPDNVAFYMQKIDYHENTETVSAGIRYEGQNPNNYIWFNNEMWRIIGVIPTKNASGTNENLVKIIRKQSLGGYAYDAKSVGGTYTGAWGSNTLYTLLNSYYWGKKDGTNTSYCYGSENDSKNKCDYRVKGIKNTDYYGSMVREVYWNTGESSDSVTASKAYANEAVIQTVKGHVGLMNASDYGYATSGSHTTNMSGYNNATHTLGNWLYVNTYEWTITQYSSSTNRALHVVNSGNVIGYATCYGMITRPVLYLDTKVYIVSGDGSEGNPYIVAKES